MSEGLDYSFSRPNVAEMKADGIKFVVRYLSTGGKGIRSDELKALHAAGINVALVYENGGSRAGEGTSAGVVDAKDAVDQATALGAPAGTAIYFAVDYDANPTTVQPYFSGVASNIGKYAVGVYGSARVVTAVRQSYAKYGWYTYAWSQGQSCPTAHLHQYQNDISLYGAQVDRTRSEKDNYGAWLANGTAAPPTNTEDEAILVNAADEAKFKAIVQEVVNDAAVTIEDRTVSKVMARIGQSLFNHSIAQGVKLQKLLNKEGIK